MRDCAGGRGVHREGDKPVIAAWKRITTRYLASRTWMDESDIPMGASIGGPNRCRTWGRFKARVRAGESK